MEEETTYPVNHLGDSKQIQERDMNYNRHDVVEGKIPMSENSDEEKFQSFFFFFFFFFLPQPVRNQKGSTPALNCGYDTKNSCVACRKRSIKRG